MTLTRGNYTMIALVGVTLAVGATSVVLADDQASALGKGVDLARPAGCAEQGATTVTTVLPGHTTMITTTDADGRTTAFETYLEPRTIVVVKTVSATDDPSGIPITTTIEVPITTTLTIPITTTLDAPITTTSDTTTTTSDPATTTSDPATTTSDPATTTSDPATTTTGAITPTKTGTGTGTSTTTYGITASTIIGKVANVAAQLRKAMAAHPNDSCSP